VAREAGHIYSLNGNDLSGNAVMPVVYTAAEAAAVIGAPVRDVNNLIHKGMLPNGALRRDGAKRLLRPALISLKAASATSEVLTAEQRRELARRVYERPSARTVRIGIVSIDVSQLATETRQGLERLARARSMVASDPEVLGGIPVFKRTRIPVHDIAAMVANGESWQDLKKAYPRLTRVQIELAPLYAKAYPRRGRPRTQGKLDRASWKKISFGDA
jgi:uncharacterized protein (DUF433 family)